MSISCDNNQNCLDYFEAMHLFATNVTRVNNVDLITIDEGKEIGLCHMPVFNNMGDSDRIKAALGAYLAMKHLNHGNGEVISELKNINLRCNMRFTTEFFNTKGSG